MKKKYWLILLVTILVLVGGIYFLKKGFKTEKNGNNKDSQKIVDYILNLNSYETQITVTVNSNKNNNKYIIKQMYQKPNVSSQEIVEPSNIAGVKIQYDGTNLKIENSQLSLEKTLENYEYITDNCLDLSSFIEDYNTSNESKYEEKNGEIIMKTNSKLENIYLKEKALHISKETGLPIKMEIIDNKQKSIIYILYNEVKIN